MKIVFLGDSLTWGGIGGRYLDEVKRRLPNADIVNAGAAGNTVLNLLARAESDVLPAQPDRAFVMVGGNEAIAHAQPETRPYYEQAQDIPDGHLQPDAFARAYRELLQLLQLHHIQPMIGLPPIEYNPAVVKALQDFNAQAADVARAHNVPVLDLMAHFTPSDVPDRPPLTLKSISQAGNSDQSSGDDADDSEFTYTLDGVHLTDAAAAEMGELIAAFIDEH